jgi:hypothetical protein
MRGLVAQHKATDGAATVREAALTAMAALAPWLVQGDQPAG